MRNRYFKLVIHQSPKDVVLSHISLKNCNILIKTEEMQNLHICSTNRSEYIIPKMTELDWLYMPKRRKLHIGILYDKSLHVDISV